MFVVIPKISGDFFLKSVNVFLSTMVVVFSVRLGDDVYRINVNQVLNQKTFSVSRSETFCPFLVFLQNKVT